MCVYISNYKHCSQPLYESFIAILAHKAKYRLCQAIISGSGLTILESGCYISELSKILYVYAALQTSIKSLDEVYCFCWVD